MNLLFLLNFACECVTILPLNVYKKKRIQFNINKERT